MAEAPTGRIPHLYRLATALLVCRSFHEVLNTAASELAQFLQFRNVILWQFSAAGRNFTPASTAFEEKGIKVKAVSSTTDYLGECFRAGKPLTLNEETIRNQNKHTQFPKDLKVTTGFCFPFKGKAELEGVLEFINPADPSSNLSQEDLDFVSKTMELVTAAARNMKTQENQVQNQLNAITRLTLLYDMSQVFHSTLELKELLPVIAEKVRDIVDAETCTVWLLDENGEQFYCGKSSGALEEAFSSYRANLEDDIAGEVIRTGEGILLEDASEEEKLLKRFANPEESPVETYIAAPLECQGKILGAVEVLNRIKEAAFFDEEDQFLLNDLAYQAAVSIHNANLLAAERKAKELDGLLKISREITSTLDLNKVMMTIVNQAALLIPYDRSAVALVDRGKVELSAVSGKTEFDRKHPEMKELQNILTWSANLAHGFYISEFNNNIVAEREEDREKFKAYFEKTGFKSFISLPLKDEEGELGILSFESSTPYFLDERHLEVISILCNQATVAVRNAQLYRQVPLINLMEPILQKKANWMKIPRSRKIAWLAGTAIFLLLFTLVPWNLRITGDVTLLPMQRIPVVSNVEGIIRTVPHREGDSVKKDGILAVLDDKDYTLMLERNRTRYDLLLKEIRRSESLGDSVSAKMKNIELSQVQREIEFSEYELESTRLRTPMEGVVITQRVEDKIGQLIRKGEQFCELADMNKARAEVIVDESDAEYLKSGDFVELKMNSYPTKEFQGNVTLLGAQVVANSDLRSYRLEAMIQNHHQMLKPGMSGKAKISTGNRSIGYVLLRKPLRFLWHKLWTWLP